MGSRAATSVGSGLTADLRPTDNGLLPTADGDESQRLGKWSDAAALLDKLPAVAAKYGDNRAALVPVGTFLLRVGRAREAVRYLENARSADPLAVSVSWPLGLAYAHAGAEQAAFAAFHRGLDIESKSVMLRGSLLLAALGERDSAELELWIASTQSNDFNMQMLAFRHWPGGNGLTPAVTVFPSGPSRIVHKTLPFAYCASYVSAPCALTSTNFTVARGPKSENSFLRPSS